jgi:hypothetical protein
LRKWGGVRYALNSLLINGLRKKRGRKGDISRVFIFYAYMLHG